MDLSSLTITIITGIISSILGALAYAKITNRQQKKLKQKIEELDYEEKFLEKISKGNIELLRSSFKVLFVTLGMTLVSAGFIMLSMGLNLPNFIQYNILLIGSSAVAAAGFIAFAHAKNLIKLNDIQKSKKQIEEKRQKIREKLK